MNIDTKKLARYDSLLLGFSAGADSTALAYLLIQAKMDFQAVHFHHHLREGSADLDADFCRAFCDLYKIPFTKVDLFIQSEKVNGESIETAARRLRQQWYKQNIDSPKTAVLLAHHKDDLRENFILRAMRGSSSTGLTGFKDKKCIEGVTYLRPLFQYTRQEIINYLKLHKLNWRQDESNNSLDYNRNRVRKNILPELSQMGSLDGLDRTLINTAKDADFLEQAAQDWLAQHEFSCENFLTCHPALQARLIRWLFRQETGSDYYPGHDAVDRLISECQRQHQELVQIPLTKEHILSITPQGKIFIAPQPFNEMWNWKETPCITIGSFKITAHIANYSTHANGESFLLDECPTQLTIRNWQPGDQITPFGRKAPQKVKKVLNEKKLTADEKLRVPMVLGVNKIIWIPGIKRAHFAKASKGDKCLVLNYERL